MGKSTAILSRQICRWSSLMAQPLVHTLLIGSLAWWGLGGCGAQRAPHIEILMLTLTTTCAGEQEQVAKYMFEVNLPQKSFALTT